MKVGDRVQIKTEHRHRYPLLDKSRGQGTIERIHDEHAYMILDDGGRVDPHVTHVGDLDKPPD